MFRYAIFVYKNVEDFKNRSGAIQKLFANGTSAASALHKVQNEIPDGMLYRCEIESYVNA